MRFARRPREGRDFDLLCVGILVLDVFGRPIDVFPEKGTSAYFDTLETHPGGCAYNTAVDAARLGMKVCVAGKTGEDAFGALIRSRLGKEAVSTEAVVVSREGSTAFSFVMVPEDGNRRIYHTPGVNNTFDRRDIRREMILRSAMLHVAGASLMPALDGEPTVELLRAAREEGLFTSLDPVVKPGIASVILPCLPYLDLFLPNVDESFLITGLRDPGDQLRFYLDHGVGTVGIKLGARGCLVSDGRDLLRLGVYDVTAVDTCGAGDAFIAGFLYGACKGWEVEETAIFATGVAAHCVESVGATTGVRDAEAVREFVRSRAAPVLERRQDSGDDPGQRRSNGQSVVR